MATDKSVKPSKRTKKLAKPSEHAKKADDTMIPRWRFRVEAAGWYVCPDENRSLQAVEFDKDGISITDAQGGIGAYYGPIPMP